MLKEIQKAVEVFHRIAFGTKNNVGKFPESKLAAFITVLTELLTVRYEKNWYPENPDRASGYRCIRVNNQSVDPTIVESLKRAKVELTKGLIRTELTIWVDPGVVSVRIGEDGSIGSEIVDEEAYNISQRTTETALKRSTSESDEGFSSSRSSSPESSSSDHSWSLSSSVSSSPIPSKYSASPSPPAMEYNPYSPPAHVSYPSLFPRPATPHLPSQRPQTTASPTTNYFQTQGVRSHGRCVIPSGPTLSSTPVGDIGQQGHIPVSSVQRGTAYTRPRSLFPAQDNGSASRATQDGKVAFNLYHTSPMMYGGNLQPTSFYDIPAMA
uniref:Anti-proliferative protein domain-containing protein n=1 Tax=Arion vulgaris TaxID=1028688 RepID=A0A0B7A853_9EUPU